VTGKGVTIASETRFTYKLAEPLVINANAAPPTPFATPAAPIVQLTLGKTIDEVTAVMGAPSEIVDLGAKKIYIYKNPRSKITFKDGRVVDAR